MRIVLQFLVATALAVVLALWTISAALGRDSSSIHNGPWSTNPTTGSSEAGLHHRAQIAAHGLWALDRSEVIYYFTITDSQGSPLRHDASYRIEGTDPDTRWWSITAYKDDHFIPNELDRYSFSQTTVQRDPDGHWTIRLSPEPTELNWLPSGDEPGSMVLTLRCYNPGPTLAASPGTVALPTIIRESRS